MKNSPLLRYVPIIYFSSIQKILVNNNKTMKNMIKPFWRHLIDTPIFSMLN